MDFRTPVGSGAWLCRLARHWFCGVDFSGTRPDLFSTVINCPHRATSAEITSEQIRSCPTRVRVPSDKSQTTIDQTRIRNYLSC